MHRPLVEGRRRRLPELQREGVEAPDPRALHGQVESHRHLGARQGRGRAGEGAQGIQGAGVTAHHAQGGQHNARQGDRAFEGAAQEGAHGDFRLGTEGSGLGRGPETAAGSDRESAASAAAARWKWSASASPDLLETH